MIIRVFTVLVGFAMAVSGGISLISYLNILPMGYSFIKYLTYVSLRIECYMFPIGIIIIFLSVYYPRNQFTNE